MKTKTELKKEMQDLIREVETNNTVKDLKTFEDYYNRLTQLNKQMAEQLTK